MTAVVDDVRTKYKAEEDISNENQIFEAYDYFVKQKDYENAAPAALYSGCVRQAKKEYESAMNCYKEADYKLVVGINIPYQKLMLNYDKYLDKNKKYFITCSKGIHSHRACALLEYLGYDVTQVLK